MSTSKWFFIMFIALMVTAVLIIVIAFIVNRVSDKKLSGASRYIEPVEEQPTEPAPALSPSVEARRQKINERQQKKLEEEKLKAEKEAEAKKEQQPANGKKEQPKVAPNADNKNAVKNPNQPQPANGKKPSGRTIAHLVFNESKNTWEYRAQRDGAAIKTFADELTATRFAATLCNGNPNLTVMKVQQNGKVVAMAKR